MRILILNVLYSPLKVGGAEKAAELLADSLARASDQVVIITLHPGNSETVEHHGNIRVYRLPMDNIYWPFGKQSKRSRAEKYIWHLRDVWNRKAAKRVGRILDIEKPDVVHSHNLSGFSVSVWREVKKRNIRLVHTLHDYYMLCVRSNLFKDGHSCAERCAACSGLTVISKLASTKPDAVVSVSEAVLNTHHKYGYFKNVPSSVIRNIEPSTDEQASASLPFSEQDPDIVIFGFIGKLSEAKGISMLLEAVAKLSRDNWRLRIAGTGLDIYIADLKHRFPDPRIEWLGYTDSQTFYASIDVTVVPSIWMDPLPYVVIESFAAGKSVICAQSGGLPELALLGKRVQTYPAMDVEALAGALEVALANKEIWKRGGFKTADANSVFKEKVVTRRYRDVYQPLSPA